MICDGNFKFKEIRKVEKGSFTNAKGEVINYGESYKLKVDEIIEDRIVERIFKVDKENTSILNQLKSVKPYTDIKLRFDVKIYNSRVQLIPITLV